MVHEQSLIKVIKYFASKILKIDEDPHIIMNR